MRWMIIGLLLWAPTALAGDDPSTELAIEVAAAQSDVNEIEGLLEASEHPAVRRQIARKLAQLSMRLENMERLRMTIAIPMVNLPVVAAPPPVMVVHTNEYVEPPVIQVVEEIIDERPVTSSSELAQIRRAIDDASFPEAQLSTLRSAAKHRWFTSDQVIVLMEEFSFGKGKVSAAAYLYPAVVDPENWYTVYSALSFDSDRRSLKAQVGDL